MSALEQGNKVRIVTMDTNGFAVSFVGEVEDVDDDTVLLFCDDPDIWEATGDGCIRFDRTIILTAREVA